VARNTVLAVTVLALALGVHAGTLRSDQVARWAADLDAAEGWVRAGELPRAGETYARVLTELPPTGAGLLRARALDGTGDVERLRGNPSTAIEAYRRAASLWVELLGARQPRLAVTLHNLGATLLDDGQIGEARTTLERALAIWSSSPSSTAEAENTRRLLARAGTRHDGDPDALAADP
jgi:tetratricopeptide (TPR) repeat protein